MQCPLYRLPTMQCEIRLLLVIKGPAEPVLLPPQVFSLPSRLTDRLLPPPAGPAEVRGGEVPRLRSGHQVPDPAAIPPAGRISQSSGGQMAPG